MAESSVHPLDPRPIPDAPAPGGFRTGILPSQELRGAIDRGEIAADSPIGAAQIQPASLDLRLGSTAYRLRASFLPGPKATIAEKIQQLAMHAVALDDGAVLERDCVYLVPLLESVKLRKGVTAIANPKSSTGRLDVFCRLLTDYGVEFDRVSDGYEGPLYAEVSPRTFSVLVRTGTRLNQLRLKRGSPPVTESGLRRLHEREQLVETLDQRDPIHQGGLSITVDISGAQPDDLVGYRARRHAPLIDLGLVDHYAPSEFWDPVYAEAGNGIILSPNEFYILASKEAVTVPPDHAAEMVAYDTFFGEFRVHYAGFFDPGFGHAEAGGGGTRAVLEVRTHEVPFLLEDGQLVGRLVYERLTEQPDRLYGVGIGSSYQRQGLQLGKQFKAPDWR